MFSPSAPVQIKRFLLPTLVVSIVVEHFKNLSNFGLFWVEYCTDILDNLPFSFLLIPMGFSNRSFRMTRKLNAPFLEVSISTSRTELLNASTGSKIKNRLLHLLNYYFVSKVFIELFVPSCCCLSLETTAPHEYLTPHFCPQTKTVQ